MDMNNILVWQYLSPDHHQGCNCFSKIGIVHFLSYSLNIDKYSCLSLAFKSLTFAQNMGQNVGILTHFCRRVPPVALTRLPHQAARTNGGTHFIVLLDST